MTQSKNIEIEMLRAIAVLLVNLSHVPFFIPWQSNLWWPTFQHAHFWFGVDIFFVISGYVVTSSLLRSRENNPTASPVLILAAFATRRAYRLLPLSWAALSLVVVLSVVWNSTGVFGTPYGNLGDAVSVLFYSANWHAYECAKGAAQACGINALYWSLSLEEQFYVALPLVLLFARRYLVAVCIAGVAIQFPFQRDLFTPLWVTRADALLIGVLIAVLRAREGSHLFKPEILKLDAIRIPIFVLALIGMSVLAHGSVVSFYVSLLAIGAGAMVWAASFNEGLLFRKEHKILVWIGSRSYAIYLFHSMSIWGVIELLSRVAGGREHIETPTYSVIVMVVGPCLTAVFAELAFRYVEKPIQEIGRRSAARLFLRVAPRLSEAAE